MIQLSEHNDWTDYLSRGGNLCQSSYLIVQKEIPRLRQIIGQREEEIIRSCEVVSNFNGYKLYDTYCAAFAILVNPEISLEGTNGSSIKWHKDSWFAREAAILTKDPLIAKIPEFMFE